MFSARSLGPLSRVARGDFIKEVIFIKVHVDIEDFLRGCAISLALAPSDEPGFTTGFDIVSADEADVVIADFFQKSLDHLAKGRRVLQFCMLGDKPAIIDPIGQQARRAGRYMIRWKGLESLEDIFQLRDEILQLCMDRPAL